jgi:hypothetical protein
MGFFHPQRNFVAATTVQTISITRPTGLCNWNLRVLKVWTGPSLTTCHFSCIFSFSFPLLIESEVVAPSFLDFLQSYSLCLIFPSDLCCDVTPQPIDNHRAHSQQASAKARDLPEIQIQRAWMRNLHRIPRLPAPIIFCLVA